MSSDAVARAARRLVRAAADAAEARVARDGLRDAILDAGATGSDLTAMDAPFFASFRPTEAWRDDWLAMCRRFRARLTAAAAEAAWEDPADNVVAAMMELERALLGVDCFPSDDPST